MNLHRPARTLLVALLALIAARNIALAQQPDDKPQKKFELKDGDRVIFLGGGLIEREQKFGYWEAALTAAYPDRNITFRNLGWSGDTVWAESRGLFDAPEKGYARMIEQIKTLKPTVIFFGYGNNEAFAGEKGLKPFIKQYEKLINDVRTASATDVKCVLISPVEHLLLPPKNTTDFDTRCRMYISKIGELAESEGHFFVDLNRTIQTMKKFLSSKAGLKKHALTERETYSKWTDDGIHWKENVYRSFANNMMLNLFKQDTGNTFGIEASGKINQPVGVDVKATRLKNGFRFDIEPKSLPIFTEIVGAHGLEVGRYELMHEGVTIGADVSSDQGRFRRMMSFQPPNTPNIERGEKLRKAIIEKNQLFFHQWRPQNFTYLFGFRKHEQGQNAKEVKEFDALIAAKEKEIAELKKPVKYTYELIRVGDEKAEQKK